MIAATRPAPRRGAPRGSWHDRAMRLLAIALGLTAALACGDGGGGAPDGPPAIDAPPPDGAGPDRGSDDVYADVFAAVDGPRLIQTLRELGGVVPVTVDGATFTIGERFSDAGRARFRAYWRAQLTALGLTVRALDYQDPQSSRPGHNLEAVLPGASPDSVIVIVHYDSIGPPGAETSNPGVDDDMTGMAILIETARLLVPYRGRLARTVRFVATDEEELGNLAGARAYARLIRAEATAGGFALVAGVDNEQSGWNCQAEGACGEPTPAPLFDVFACGDQYAFPELADRVAATVARYGGLGMARDCIGANSDHYALWEIGVPAVVIGEHRPFFNPHFDQNGGDTFDRIDQAYFVGVARPSIAFQAELVGITP